MAIRYQRIARHIISESHVHLKSGVAFALAEILEVLDVEEYLDQVLPDNDAERGRRLEALADALRKEGVSYDDRRLTCPVQESDIATGSFLYAHMDRADLTSAEREYRARLRCTPDLMQRLYRLTPRDFEVLCGYLLERLGCKNVTVTSAQGDDGVDGVAELPLVDKNSLSVKDMTAMQRLVADLSFLVYLQAKRYNAGHPVEKSEVHELIGSWHATLAEFSDGKLAPERRTALLAAGFKVADPVLLIFVTTSTFRTGALTRGKAAGLILLDGEQLAHLLAILGLGIEAEGKFSFAVSNEPVERYLESLVPPLPGMLALPLFA